MNVNRPSQTNQAAGNCAALQQLLSPAVRRTFSNIYENLLISNTAQQPKAVLVCSASSGDGATTIASGLAIAAAEQIGKPVLLIDGNCRKPKIGELFSLKENGGLNTLLSEVSNVQVNSVMDGIWKVDPFEAKSCWNDSLLAAVQQTSVPNLWVLSTGKDLKSYIHCIEPLDFRSLLNRLLRAYSFILIDGPPVITFPESVMYAPQVDRVLLVIRAGVTRIPVVSKVLTKLNNVEIILNRRVFVIPQAIYKRL